LAANPPRDRCLIGPASGSPAPNVVAELTPKRVRQIALLKFDED